MSVMHEIKSRVNNPMKLFPLLVFYIQKLYKKNFNTDSGDTDVTVEIVIPTIEKDYSLLKIFIESVKLNLNHNILNIHIISKYDDILVQFCRENGLNFVDENSIMKYTKESLNYIVRDINRNGWLFQQLLKLGADKIVQADNYIVIDSDTILLNKHSFINKQKKMTLFQSAEWHKPYFLAFEKLFTYKTVARLSFVSHMMVFNKKILSEMKIDIEKRHNVTWDQAIIAIIDKNELSSFSEYETYGNYLLKHYPDKIELKPFYNKSLNKKQISPLVELQNNYSKKYNSVSFHTYQK